MRLTTHGDQRFDPRLLASRDIRRAEIAGIRQQAFGLAQFVGKSLDLVQHRFELLLVVGRLAHGAEALARRSPQSSKPNELTECAPMLDINLQFNKLTKKQKDAIDHTVVWINDLITNHGFRLTRTDPCEQGCVIEVVRNQDLPVWARMNIRVDFVILEDIDDNRLLSEYSQIYADCLMTNSENDAIDIELGGEWPLTMSGLKTLTQRLERFLAKFNEWNLKAAP